MLDIPDGATVARTYYALPNSLGIVGAEYDNLLDANLAALRKWGAMTGSDFAVNPPRVDQRMVFEFPEGGGVDTVVASSVVFERLTLPAPTSAMQRAAIADTAITQMIKTHEQATQALAAATT